MEEIGNINERISFLVDKLARSRNTKFAAMIGSNEANVRGYIRNVMPRYDVLEKIINNLHVNPTWLFTGKGPVMQDEEPVVVRPPKDTVSVPVVDISVAAGKGYENPDYLDKVDTIELPKSMINPDGTYFCIRVKGESMTPTILDSSYVVIRLLDRSEWTNMPDEHVYVVSNKEGHAYIKRVKNRLKGKGFIVCMSDNPDKFNFPNFNLQLEDIHTVFHVEWLMTARMPNIHTTYYAQIGELQDNVDELKANMNKVLKAIASTH